MVVFRSIKINEWHHLDGDRLRIVLCQLLNGGFDHRNVFFIGIINSRAILQTAISALTVDTGRIYRLKV